MSFLKELLYIFHIIAVHTFCTIRGESHRNDTVCDVRKIEVKTILLETFLLLRDEATEHIRKGIRVFVFVQFHQFLACHEGERERER